MASVSTLGGGDGCRYHSGTVRVMAMNLRITEEQDRLLTELARSQGVSKNEAAVRAIEVSWARRRHETQVRDLTRAAIERYGPLLDRLAQ